MSKVEDKNGFWFIEKNPITRVGVFNYLGKQISSECEPNKIYKVLRPKEELFKKETLDSLRLIPIVNNHEMIGKGFTAPEDKGIDGTLGDNVSHDTDTIYNDLKIMSNKMKEDIKNGKKELSLGYFCRYDKQPGIYNGQAYDYVQRDIKANHLALVDKGRMGADVRVYDSKNQGGSFAMDSIDITMDKDEGIEWITVRGTHIPIKKGESKEQAVKNFLERKKQSSGSNEDKDREYRNKLFREAASKVAEKKKTALENELKELQNRQKEREREKENNEEMSYKEKMFLELHKKREQKRIEEIQKELGGESKRESEEKNDSLEINGTILLNTGFNKNKDNTYSKQYEDGTKVTVHKKNDKKAGEYHVAEITKENGEKSSRLFMTKNTPFVIEQLAETYKEKNGQDSLEYKNTQGEDGMAELKKDKPVLDEDKRKLIDEIGGILKDKVSEEDWRTIVGKIEKIAYNGSEAGKATDEDGEEELVNVKEKEVKDKKKAVKDKCGKDKEEVEEKETEEEEEKEVEKKGMDEADIVRMIARKDKLAKAVAKVVGTFDHSEMTEQQVAEYACDKLDLPVKKGEEITGINCYLKSLPKTRVTISYGMDGSAYKVDAEFEKFQKGE